MSLAIAVRIEASSVRSIARRGRPALGRGAEVGDDVHRVGGRAAVAEREQLAAALEARPRDRSAAASEGRRGSRSASARREPRPPPPSAGSTGARRRPPPRGRARPPRGRGRGSSRRPCRAPAPPRALRAGRGARRRRAPAPRARGRASRPAPGATNGSRPGGCELPLGAPRARRRSSGSPARAPIASASRDLARRVVLDADRRSRCRRRSAISVDLDRQRPALRREPDRRERALADDHRVDELDRDVAGVGARRPANGRAPPAGRPSRTAPPSDGSSAPGARPPPRRRPRLASVAQRRADRRRAADAKPGDHPVAAVASPRGRTRTGGGRPPAPSRSAGAAWRPARAPAPAPGRPRSRARSPKP